MTLARRLLAGSIVVITLLAMLVVFIAAGRLEDRLLRDTVEDLSREAQLIAVQWQPGVNADSLADTTGSLLLRRVTLIDDGGRVVGDSDFDGPALAQLDNHRLRPEVVDANLHGFGSAQRASASAGDAELYVAVRAVSGVARVSISTQALVETIRGAQRDVVVAALVSMLIAAGLSLLLARQFSRPIVELRDVARSIAAGDLQRRPQLSAPGEVGDLADAVSRMTEQLAARLEALEKEDAFMTTLFDSLNEGVLALDGRAKVVRINQRARELLEIRDATPFTSTNLPRDRGLQDVVARSLSGETPDQIESIIGARALALTARPMQSGGAVVTFFDMTTFRRLEAMRRDFVANVSHELRTPLTVVIGFAETLATNRSLPAEDQKFANAILTHSKRMQLLLDDLLDLSRIESGGWTPQSERVNVEQVIREVLTTFDARASASGVALHVDVPVALELHADPTALRQVLTNLVSNAIRHTSQGSITVAGSREDGWVTLAVRDTGSGIAAEHLPRIFERFYRADRGRARSDGGTGLGLAIVRHLVEAHGGSVAAESTLGVGTTVTARWPLIAGNSE